MATLPTGKSSSDIIRGALRSLGVLDPAEAMTAGEAADGLEALNDMLDAWDSDGLMIFTTKIEDFPLVASQQTYTLGAGGNFNTDRPATIDRVGIVILSNPAQPLEYSIPVYSTQDWADKVPIKNVPGNLPLLVYDDGAFPLRSLTFWPVASDNTLVRFYNWQHLQKFTDFTTKYAFPEGYSEAIRFNLAVRLAPEFGVSVSPELGMLAMQSLATVKSSNPDDTQLRSDILNTNTPSKMRSELFNIP